MLRAGEIAAVGTAVCWAFAANFFVASGRRIGSVQLNRLRLLVAGILLCATLWITHGAPWPTWGTQRQLLLLGASGLAGFALGDSFYFRALVILGAGRAALLLATGPIFTALFAWLWMGESLGPRAVAGMLITVGGVALVLYGRHQNLPAHAEGSAAAGVVYGMLSAVGAAAGYVLSKMGLGGRMDALSGTLVRVTAAAAALWLAALLRNALRGVPGALRDRTAVRTMVAGSVFGPFLGVTLSLFALQNAPAAVATSLFAISPLFAMAIGARVHREPVGVRTVIGALIAVGGVLLLFSRHS
jgi:drug/metabolite transporter (DMT)-like permease